MRNHASAAFTANVPSSGTGPYTLRAGRICLVALAAWLASASARSSDPLPYAPIANPLPDTMDIQRRDSVNLKISPIRVNQAGYRLQDEKLFYYIGTSASAFSVLNAATGSVAGSGTLTSLGVQSSGQLKMTCYYKAQLTTGGDIKYQLLSPSVSGTVFKGFLPAALPEGKYRVVVGADTSAPFVIRDDVYGMVRDALLKYYGVARCGNNESWFHPSCHMKDAVPGGWHDAGDHLKLPHSIGYSLSVLGLCAAGLRDRDQDHYAKNQAVTLVTDGIPDVLAETRIGADFLVKSYELGGQSVAGMKTEIGNFGQDHLWWGRPEYQDSMPVERGGPPRQTRMGLGGNTAGSLGAGLAFAGRLWKPYDSAFSKKCIKIAIELYAWGKANVKEPSYYNEAMSGGGRHNDELALCALALWWATNEPLYKNDLLYDKAIGSAGNPAIYPKGGFAGGWMTNKQAGLFKDRANSDWDNLDNYVLWGLYRLILIDEATAAFHGIDAQERLNLIEDVLYCLIANILDVSAGDQSITLPAPSFGWKTGSLKCSPLWGWMHTQQEWMPNRYHAGNITDLFCYYDIASKIAGTPLPNSPASTDWKVTEVKSVLLKQLNYMLGMNPWDVSMITGVGAKNLNHPHHRAATPELQNVPGVFYRYRPPVGGFSAGYAPTTALYDEYMGGTSNPWYHTEISIDATTSIFLPIMGLAKNEGTAPLTANVQIVDVGFNSATIIVNMSPYGTATIQYGTIPAALTSIKASDSSGVQHIIKLTGLTKGTTYYLDALIKDLFGNQAVILDVDPDKNKVPFKFTTLSDAPGNAVITNVKICKVTHDSVEVFWYTSNGNFDSKMVCDTVKPPTAFTATDVKPYPVCFHYVKMGGLKPKTTYYFYVQSGTTVDNNKGAFYTFTTTGEHVKFDVRGVRYATGNGMPALGMNIINQDVKTYDSLDLRLYFRAKDGFEDDLGARMDIGIVYDESGSQAPFSKNTEIQNNIKRQRPTKMPDTYNPADGTYAFYLSIPLWGVWMKSGSRIRLDIVFDRRSPYPPYQDLMNQPPQHQISPEDWSFGPHSKAKGDPVDFGGINLGSFNDVDGNYWALEIDHYITVYRKNEFVWGYSPSLKEQLTKKNYYELETQIVAPLNNPSQDYVFIERVVPSVDISGWAKLSPPDAIMDEIWINGVKIPNVAQVVKWNDPLQRYDFLFPAAVHEGKNPMDVTFFAGPKISDSCFGCASTNHRFFIEFRGAKKYPSQLTLNDTAGKSIPSGDTAHIDTTLFHVTVTDKNGNTNGKAKDTLLVTVSNPSAGDSILLHLVETGDSTGEFHTVNPVLIVSTPPGQHGQNQIFMSGGDIVWIKYVDPTDPADSSSAFFTSKADFPVPVRGWLKDADGNGTADSAVVLYDKNLTSPPDSLWFFFPDASTQRTVKTGQGAVTPAPGGLALVSIAPPFAAATTAFISASNQGKGYSFLTVQGKANQKVFPVADSVGPILTSASVVERLGQGVDTLYVTLSEDVKKETLMGASFILIQNGASIVITVDDFKSLLNATVLVLKPGTPPPKAGDSLRINPAGPLADLSSNKAHQRNPAVPLGLKQMPAGIQSAYYLDRDADGEVDTAVMQFVKKVNTGDLSLSFDWGSTLKSGEIKGAALGIIGGDSTKVRAYIRGAFSPAPLIKTSGEMFVSPKFISLASGAGGTQAADSAAPVIERAIYRPSIIGGSSSPDTLVVHFSEPAGAGANPSPFRLRAAATKTEYTFTLSPLGAAGGAIDTFRVTGTSGVAYPRSGDTIWINPATCVADKGGLYQKNPNNRRVPLEVIAPPGLWKHPIVIQNPFVPDSQFTYYGMTTTGTFIAIIPNRPDIAAELWARVRIYDVAGNTVFYNQSPQWNAADGGYYFPWDGYNKNGRIVGTGTYLCEVVTKCGSEAAATFRLKIGVKR